MPLPEPRVGLGIGACCLALENSPPGIYIHSLAPGSVAKMESNLRFVTSLALYSPGVVLSCEDTRYYLLRHRQGQTEIYSPGWLWTYYIAKDDLKFLISRLYLPNAKIIGAYHCAHLFYLIFSVEFNIFDFLSNNLAKTNVNISKDEKLIWIKFDWIIELWILVSAMVLIVHLTQSRITWESHCLDQVGLRACLQGIILS